jgi:hypothetical protein
MLGCEIDRGLVVLMVNYQKTNLEETKAHGDPSYYKNAEVLIG